MLKIYPLFSGSSGNSILVESDNTALLLDAGVSAKKIVQALDAINKEINDIKYIVISHEHQDHIAGIDILLKKSKNFKVCASNKTWSSLNFKNITDDRIVKFTPNEHIILGDITVYPFPISHDAIEPCGFNFIVGKDKISCVTDLGYMTPEIEKLLKNSSTVYIEANHEVGMVECSMYPAHLKRRILGKNGHLSNDASAETICSLAKDGTQNFILGHLSDHNNTPEMAMQAITSCLTSNDVNLDKIDLTVACKSIL